MAAVCTLTSRCGRVASRCLPETGMRGCRRWHCGTSADLSSMGRRWRRSLRQRRIPKRLVPGFEAPVNLAYSRRNRSAACRIPMYSASPKAKRVEFRPPDPSCNPYMGFAAMMMAGLDGVEHKIDPGQPLDKDIYDLGAEELAKVPSMPGSLEDALDALEKDHQFLLKGDVFTEGLLDTYIEYKRAKEVDAVRLRPHPYEFMLYYDI